MCNTRLFLSETDLQKSPDKTKTQHQRERYESHGQIRFIHTECYRELKRFISAPFACINSLEVHSS